MLARLYNKDSIRFLVVFAAVTLLLATFDAVAAGDEPGIREKSTHILLTENDPDDNNVTGAVIDAACSLDPGDAEDPCTWKRFTQSEACITHDPQHHDPSGNPKKVRVMFNTTQYKNHKAELWYYASTNCEYPVAYTVALCQSNNYTKDLDCKEESGDIWVLFRGDEEILNTCEPLMGDQKIVEEIELTHDYHYFRFDPYGTPIEGCGIFIDSGEDQWDSTGVRMMIENNPPKIIDAGNEEEHMKQIPQAGGDMLTKFDIDLTWEDPEGDEIVETHMALHNTEGAVIHQCWSRDPSLKCELHNIDQGNYRLVANATDEFGAFYQWEKFIAVDVPLIELRILDVSDQEVSEIHPKSKLKFEVTTGGVGVPEASVEVRALNNEGVERVMSYGVTNEAGILNWDSELEAVMDMVYFVGELKVVAFKTGSSIADKTVKLKSDITVAETPESGCRGVSFKVRVIDEWGQGVTRGNRVNVKMLNDDTVIGNVKNPDENGYVEFLIPSDFDGTSIDIIAEGDNAGKYYRTSEIVTLPVSGRNIDFYVFPTDTCLAASIYVKIDSKCYPKGSEFDIHMGGKKQGTCPGPTVEETGGVYLDDTAANPWCRLSVDPKTSTGSQGFAIRVKGTGDDETVACKTGTCKVNIAAVCGTMNSCGHSWGAAQSTGVKGTVTMNFDIDPDKVGRQICPGDVIYFKAALQAYNVVCSDGSRHGGTQHYFSSYARISRCGDIPDAGNNPVCDMHRSPIIEMGGKSARYLSNTDCMLCEDGACTKKVNSPGVIAFLRKSGGSKCMAWTSANDKITTPDNYAAPKAPGVYTVYVDSVTRVCDSGGHYACPDCGGEGDRGWGCNQYSDTRMSSICKFGSCNSAKAADGWRLGMGDESFDVVDPQLDLTESPEITELCPGATISFKYRVTCTPGEAYVYLDKISGDPLATCSAGVGLQYRTEQTCSFQIPADTARGQHKVLIARDVNDDGEITCDPTTCAFDVKNCECDEFYVKVQKPQIAIYDPPIDLDLNICPAKGDPLHFSFTSQCTTKLRKIELLHGGDDKDTKTFSYEGDAPECNIVRGNCEAGDNIDYTSCEGVCDFTPTASFGPDNMDLPKLELRLYNAQDTPKGSRQVGIWRSADVKVESATVTTAIPDGYDEWPQCSPVQKIRVVLTNVGDGIAYLKNGFDLYDYIPNYDPRSNKLYLEAGSQPLEWYQAHGVEDADWQANFCTLSAEPLVSNSLKPGRSRILVYHVECNTWKFMVAGSGGTSSFNRGFQLRFKYQDLCDCTNYNPDQYTRVIPNEPDDRFCKQVNQDAQGTYESKVLTISWLGAGSNCILHKDGAMLKGYCSPDDGGVCMEPLATEPSPCFPGHCGPISECLYNECCAIAGGTANCGICEDCGVVRHIADANGCEVGEDCTEYSNDCGACPITCDNGICDSLTDGDCPDECIENGVCDIIELGQDPLPRDCLAPIFVCGDHNCQYERGETTASCPADCCGLPEDQAGPQAVCTNGICDYWESWQTTPDDCQLSDMCGVPDPLSGSLVCDMIQGESCENCPSDCGVCESCDSDGECEPAKGEGIDCADCLDASCPDGVCQEDEKTGPNKCPADCYTPLPPVPEAQTSISDVTGLEGFTAFDAEFVLDGNSPPPVLSLRTNIDQVKKKYLKITNLLEEAVTVQVNVSTGVKTLASINLDIPVGEYKIVEFTVTSITDLQVKYDVVAGGNRLYYDSWITTSVETDIEIGEVTDDDLTDDEAKAQLVANLAFIVTCENDACALNVDELTYTLEDAQTTLNRYYGIDNRLSYPLGLKVEIYDADHAPIKTLPDPPKDLGAETDNQYVFNVTSEGIATYYLKVRIAHCVAGSCPTAPADLEAALEEVGEVTVFVTAKLATGETVGVQEGESQGVFFQNTQMIQQAAIGKDYIEAVVSNTADSEMECAISFAYEKDDGTKISNDLDMSSIGGCHVEARTTKIVRIPVSGPVKGELIVESKNQVGDGTFANKVVNKIPITVGGFEATISDACFSDACFEDESSEACKQSKAECDRSKDVKANVITTGPGEIIDVPVFIKNPTDFKMPVSIQVINAAGKPLVIKDGEYYNLTLQPRSSKYVVLPVSGPTDFTVQITSTVCKGDPDLESGAECRDVVQKIPFKVNLKVGGYRMGACRYNWECVSGNCITAVGRCCRSGWFWSPLRAMCVDDLPFFDPEAQPRSLALTVGAMHLYPVYIQNPYEGEIAVTLSVSGSATTHITLDCGENVGVKTCTYKLAKGEQRVIQIPLIAGKVGTTSLVIEAAAAVPQEVRAEPLTVNLVVLSGSTGGSDLVTAPGVGVVESLALLALAGAYLGRKRD